MLKCLLAVMLCFSCSLPQYSSDVGVYDEFDNLTFIDPSDKFPFNILYDKCPLGFSLVVAFVDDLKGALAKSAWDNVGERFIIIFDRSVMDNGELFFNVCLHEYAHAMTWDVADSDHGAYWGVAYARTWTAVFPDDGDD